MKMEYGFAEFASKIFQYLTIFRNAKLKIKKGHMPDAGYSRYWPIPTG